MRINDFKISDNEMISMGFDYLMENEVENKMNQIDNINLNFEDINKNFD